MLKMKPIFLNFLIFYLLFISDRPWRRSIECNYFHSI